MCGARGARVLEMAISKGTTHMRTHVEVDPRAGLRSFEAIRSLKTDYAWGIDLSICVFPQEGLTNDPGAEELLEAALANGADVLGGCPYTDLNPEEQIRRLFALARRFNVDLDFHLDFDLDPEWMHLDLVCREAERFGYGGRVAVGHVTKLSMLAPEALAVAARRLADAGVALTVLPATDLYLMGRDRTHGVPRGLAPAHRLKEHGVRCSVATNNVLNPFTPFGDCSLLRMAQFYANVAQVGPQDFEACIDLVTVEPARSCALRITASPSAIRRTWSCLMRQARLQPFQLWPSRSWVTRMGAGASVGPLLFCMRHEVRPSGLRRHDLACSLRRRDAAASVKGCARQPCGPKAPAADMKSRHGD